MIQMIDLVFRRPVQAVPVGWVFAGVVVGAKAF